MHRVVVTADLVCEDEIGIESARDPPARHDVNAQYATVAGNCVARRMGHDHDVLLRGDYELHAITAGQRRLAPKADVFVPTKGDTTCERSAAE